MAHNEEYWRQVLSGEREGAKYTAMRGCLSAFELLYSGGLWLYLAAERVGFRKRQRLDVPVISIGNLSVGGTGKTPMTQWMARKLSDIGYRPAVLNRGHGGSLSPRSALVSDADGRVLLTAAEAGDEAMLLAKSLPGIPVVVGKDRCVSAQIALDRFQTNVIVLDDGFQYWQLARDLDIVLLDSTKPFDNGHALPRGFLREPKQDLRRAQIVVLTRSDSVDEPRLMSAICDAKALAPECCVFTARHVPSEIVPANSMGEGRSPERPMLVSGIAQPGSFQAAVEQKGIDFVRPPMVFPDHQEYGPQESSAILKRMKECGAESVITTEKDAVKMVGDFIEAPLFEFRVRIKVNDEVQFWEAVRSHAGLVEVLHA